VYRYQFDFPRHSLARYLASIGENPATHYTGGLKVRVTPWFEVVLPGNVTRTYDVAGPSGDAPFTTPENTLDDMVALLNGTEVVGLGTVEAPDYKWTAGLAAGVDPATFRIVLESKYPLNNMPMIELAVQDGSFGLIGTSFNLTQAFNIDYVGPDFESLRYVKREEDALKYAKYNLAATAITAVLTTRR